MLLCTGILRLVLQLSLLVRLSDSQLGSKYGLWTIKSSISGIIAITGKSSMSIRRIG